MRLAAFLRPTLGRGGAALSPNEACLTPFLNWRYADGGASFHSCRVSGRRLVVISRKNSYRGIQVNRILDVFDDEGRRRFDLVSRAISCLPGPGISVARLGGLSTCPGAIFVRRKWDVPFIIQRVCGSIEAEQSFARVVTSYGDIDAA